MSIQMVHAILCLFVVYICIHVHKCIFPSSSPLFTLPLEPCVSQPELLVIMETKWWARPWVTWFMLDLLKLAVCPIGLWDQ